MTPAATSNNHQMVQLRLDVASNEHESDEKRGNSARDLESNKLQEPYIKVESDQLANKLGFLRTQTKLLESADSQLDTSLSVNNIVIPQSATKAINFDDNTTTQKDEPRIGSSSKLQSNLASGYGPKMLDVSNKGSNVNPSSPPLSEDLKTEKSP